MVGIFASDRRRRGLTHGVVGRLLALYLLIACSTSYGATQTVQALRYGVTLFHYYQQDYFTALTELMVAQQLRQLGPHEDSAELLRGGMSLSYGMDREAEQIFVQFLGQAEAGASGAAGVDRDRAWFYLAKLAWQRAEYGRADRALSQMSPAYDGALAEEAGYLRAALSLREGDEENAARQLQQLPDDSLWRRYYYYNSGAALAARGDWHTAAHFFSRFHKLPAAGAENKLLRDKALTAAGYARLSAGDWQRAANDFNAVRLNSPQSERALLGYGWSFAEQGQYLAALAPWQVLSERNPVDESVRAGLLAIPFAYEKLGNHGLAMASYRSAAEAYEAELDALEQAMDFFREGDIVARLGLGDAGDAAWVAGGDLLPGGEQAPYLEHLASRHSFQHAARGLQDLHRISANLARADERLQVLSQADREQQRTWAAVLSGAELPDLARRQQALRERLAQLQGEFEQAQTAGDGRWFATPEQAGRWRRLERAERLNAQLEPGPEQQQRLRLYRGLLQWQDSEAYPARRWEIRTELQRLQALLDESELGMAAVHAASAGAGQASFQPRIEQLRSQLTGQRERAQGAIDLASARLRHVTLAELQRQHDSLSSALGQSRLAIARMYDVASTGPAQ